MTACAGLFKLELVLLLGEDSRIVPLHLSRSGDGEDDRFPACVRCLQCCLPRPSRLGVSSWSASSAALLPVKGLPASCLLKGWTATPAGTKVLLGAAIPALCLFKEIGEATTSWAPLLGEVTSITFQKNKNNTQTNKRRARESERERASEREREREREREGEEEEEEEESNQSSNPRNAKKKEWGGVKLWNSRKKGA